MRRLFGLFAFLSLVVMTSCTHKELCLHHPHTITLNVEFDWRDAPDADPTGMCVMFYPLDGKGYHRCDFNNTKGGEIQLKVGKYRAVCHNNDTQAMLFSNTSDFETYSAYTRESDVLEPLFGNTTGYVPKTPGAEDGKAVLVPDMMWGCCAFDIEVTDDGVEYTCVPYSDYIGRSGQRMSRQEHVMTLFPHELICTYTYEVRNVKNLKHMSQMSGTLSGMSGVLTFFNEDLDKESVTLPFGASSDGESTVSGRFYTFGHHEENADPHKMTFYVIMDDGGMYRYKDSENLDVTAQIHDAPDKRNVHIIIEGLNLPQPVENEEGFKPSVEDWITEDHDIII